jgi:metal-responsive CopG/Arc/MetJ family transcriptional regulator
MKTKITITLSEELLARIDRIIEGRTNRSTFVKMAIHHFLNLMEREQRDRADLAIINQHAEMLNRETSEVLSYQNGL